MIYKKGIPVTLQTTARSLCLKLLQTFGRHSQTKAGSAPGTRTAGNTVRLPTQQAIFCVRRLQEYAEQSGQTLLLLFLDWEKACDRLIPGKILEALHRLGVPQELQDLVNALSSSPRFKVKSPTKDSRWHIQETGIRQGCHFRRTFFLSQCRLCSRIFIMKTTVK